MDNIDYFIAERGIKGKNEIVQCSHFHKYYEIYYLIHGSRKFFVEDTVYKMYEGYLIIVSEGKVHKSTRIKDESYEKFLVCFSKSYLSDLYDEFMYYEIKDCINKPCKFSGKNKVYIETLLNKMSFEASNPDNYSPVLLRNYINELIIFLVREKNYSMLYSDNHQNLMDNTIQKAIRYICSNYANNITLKKISEYTNMSPTYFSKKFSRETGFGFKEYLLNVRLRAASFMLVQTNKSVTEIAMQCGFNDSNYFGDVFKKNKGMSPTIYRKNNELTKF